jgi:phospholipase/carboxylesterase
MMRILSISGSKSRSYSGRHRFAGSRRVFATIPGFCGPGFRDARPKRGPTKAMTELETVELETGINPRSAVIWMHGLGADAHDFEPIVPMLDLGADRPVRYVFPNAPSRPVTINGGMVMRAWYDILSMDRAEEEDRAGLGASAAAVTNLIQREVSRGIDTRNIALAGFSQGGAVALLTALLHPEPLAGVLALSTYLPLADQIANQAHPANAGLSIFMAHGNADDVVPINFARNSRKKLFQMGYDVRWNEYAMPHAMIPEEIADIKTFFMELL